MSEVAVKPLVTARARLRLARLVPYLLLQMLIVIACILVLRLLQPSDPDDFALSEFTQLEDGVTRPVTLPHFTSSRYSLADPPLKHRQLHLQNRRHGGLVGVPAALQQRRGGRGQRRGDPRFQARCHRCLVGLLPQERSATKQ